MNPVVHGSSAEALKEPLGAAAKRMLPVWVLVICTAVISLIVIKSSGTRFLRAGFYEIESTCEVAEIKYLSAMKEFREISEEIAGDSKDLVVSNLREADSFGKMSQDPRLASVRAKLLEAVRLCPGQIKGAHEALAAIEWWDGNEAESHYRLGEEHLVQKESEFAATEFEIAYATEPTNAAYAMALAGTLANLGRIDDAAGIVENAPEGAADTVISWRVRGQLLREQRKFDESMAALQRSLEIEPGNFEAAWRFLASGHDAGREYEASLWLYENMTRSEAPAAWIYHSLSLRLMKHEDFKVALDSIERARAIAPNSIELMLDNALILYKLERGTEALRLIEQALSSNHSEFLRLFADGKYDPVRNLAAPRLGSGPELSPEPAGET